MAEGLRAQLCVRESERCRSTTEHKTDEAFFVTMSGVLPCIRVRCTSLAQLVVLFKRFQIPDFWNDKAHAPRTQINGLHEHVAPCRRVRLAFALRARCVNPHM